MMNRGVMDRQMFRKGGAVFPDLSGDGQVTQKDILMGRGVIPMQAGGMVREPTVVESLVEVMRGGSTADVDRFISQNMEMLSQSGNPFAMRAVDDFMRRNAPAPRAPMGAPQAPMQQGIDPAAVEAMMGAPQGIDPAAVEAMMGAPQSIDPAAVEAPMGAPQAPVQRYQDGGMAMPAPMPAAPGPMGMAGAPMPAAPSPEEMAAIPFEQAQQMAMQQGIDPAAVEAMLADVSGRMQNLDNAQNYEEVINGIREIDAPISARYAELASIVGKEDADQTPESVLTLVQPVIMMAGIDQGIGSLASEEMTAPVTGDMAGGIMSTVNMGTEEVPPVNFNQGGAVQYFAPQNANRVAMPGGRLGEIYQQQRDVYRTIMGAGEQEKDLEEQRNLTQAQMLFDIAQGALGFAGGAGKPGGSPAEQLAAAFTPVLGNIGARAGELQKFKQAQAKETRAMDVAALQQAGSLYAAEEAAAMKDVGTPLRVTIYDELEEDNRRVINVMDTVLTRRDLKNLINKFGEGNVEVSSIPKATTREVKPGRLVGPDGKVIYNFDMNNPVEFAEAQAFANRTPGARIYRAGTERAPTSSKIDTFGKSLQGKVKNFLEGEGSADLANRYAAGRTTPDETNQIEGAIGYYTNPQKVWNAEKSVYEMVAPNKLIDVWREALKRRQGIKGASMPPIGQAERDRLKLVARPGAGTGAGAGAGAGAEVSVKGATYESLTKDIASIGAINDLTGRSAALQSWLNQASEVLAGTPIFKDTAKAQNLVQNINTTAILDIARALPGKESNLFLQKIGDLLPPVAAFTSGSEIALNKTRAFEAYLNQQISALNRRIESPTPMPDVGALRQNAQILESYRDIYQKLGNMLEADLASGRNKANRPSLGTFFKPQGK